MANCIAAARLTTANANRFGDDQLVMSRSDSKPRKAGSMAGSSIQRAMTRGKGVGEKSCSGKGFSEEVQKEMKEEGIAVERPILMAFVVVVLNLVLGALAGLAFSAIELPTEFEERRARAAVIARLNSTLNETDWSILVEALGHSVEGLQADVLAIEVHRTLVLTFTITFHPLVP